MYDNINRDTQLLHWKEGRGILARPLVLGRVYQMFEEMTESQARQQILNEVGEYCDRFHVKKEYG